MSFREWAIKKLRATKNEEVIVSKKNNTYKPKTYYWGEITSTESGVGAYAAFCNEPDYPCTKNLDQPVSEEDIFQLIRKIPANRRKGDKYLSIEDKAILTNRVPGLEEEVDDAILSYWLSRSKKAIKQRRYRLEKEDSE